METPLWKFDEISEGVYEPREDSFLLLDSIEADLNLIKDKCQPTIVLEVGSGSGIIISAVSKALNTSALCLAIDINKSACKITSQTASLNNVTVEVLRSDLLCGLKLDGLVDLFLINPPYVPSIEEEENSILDKAWAGLDQGRVLVNRLFKDLPQLMSKRCLGYLVAIEENNPEEITNTLNSLGFTSVIIARKKIIGEKLSVIRFSKGVNLK
ncbi:hypothetical protein O3M35_006352 [Rhynocoris fuscipes]|uniref:Methyltransferase HEMK2 n=1 Tax=Rhynocoris fuscipes TaxID=488301 RepID=A0AAW1DD18_9HEMI